MGSTSARLHSVSASAVRVTILLLTTALLLCGLFPCTAAAADELRWIKVRYADSVTGESEWSFPYSDSFFASSAEVYSHRLAQSSLGLALAAFRKEGEEKSDVPQDYEVGTFLKEAGFSELESADYDQKPSLQTVSTMIAHKVLRDGDGEYVLLAVAVCGGNYGLEWMSNVSVGTTTRHEGFNHAAQAVNGRILMYLAEHRLTGRMKLWVTGYSRAAAITNIVAADMTDYGPFGAENVFAYAFACPRTTKDENAGRYKNIFNIAGKFDPVTKTPLPDWGFTRYGVTLNTPAQETDSDYALRRTRADGIYRILKGYSFLNQTEINQQIRTLFSYLYEVIPTPETYTDNAQEDIKDLMESRSIRQTGVTILKLADNRELINENNRHEANALMNYLLSMAWELRSAKGDLRENWYDDYGLTGNLVREHTPEFYIAWLFSSDDPDEIYSDAVLYERYIIEGECDLLVSDADFHPIQRMDAEGRTRRADQGQAWEGETSSVDVSMLRREGQSIVTLPMDRRLLLQIENPAGEAIRVYRVTNDINVFRTALPRTAVIAKENADGFLLNTLGRGNDALDDWMQEYPGSPDSAFDEIEESEFLRLALNGDLGYSESFLQQIEQMNILKLSWLTILNIAGAVVLLLLIVIITLEVIVIRRIRKPKRTPAESPAPGDTP